MKTPTLVILLILLGLGCNAQRPTGDHLTKLNEALASGTYPNIDGIIVSQNNVIVVEEYYKNLKRDSLHDTRSAFKSITSLLAGIAIDQRLFSVNDKIERFITEWKNDPRGQITIRNLLEMKSGLACEDFFGLSGDCETEMWESKDWLNYILNIPLQHDPGLNWQYSSMEPELIGIIIARASRMSLVEFARKNLFEPLGIHQYKWHITPRGTGYAAGSFYMKPADMVRIAQLVLDNGKWKGKQIISEAWIKESTNCQIDVEMSFVRYARTKNAKYNAARYGYFWYREKLQYGNINTDVVFASGNGGQYMMVLKDYNAAVVFTGSNFGNWKGKLPFDILLKYVIPMLAMGN